MSTNVRIKAGQFKRIVEQHNASVQMDVEDYERFLEAYPDLASTEEGERFLLKVLRDQGYDV